MYWKSVKFAYLMFFFGVSGSATGTGYQHRDLAQVLEAAEVIATGTVTKSLPTGDHRRACVFTVDEVLSGPLTTDEIQVNRGYIRMGFPRNDYETSETLVFCLRRMKKPTHRPWPEHSPNLPFFEPVGLDAEGEFPLVNDMVWVRLAPFKKGEKERYAGEDLIVHKVPYEKLKTITRKLQHTPRDMWSEFWPVLK